MHKYCLLLLLPSLVMARDFPEKHYQEQWCKGKVEHVLPDRARVDCLTSEYAIEIDFADKWAESIGQALYYANETGRKPGVVLILESPGRDARYLTRFHNASQGLGITLWVIVPE